MSVYKDTGNGNSARSGSACGDLVEVFNQNVNHWGGFPYSYLQDWAFMNLDVNFP